MAKSAYDLVRKALTLVGAVDIGNPPDAALGEIGRTTLNQMRSSWNAAGIALYGTASLEITATGAGSYTVTIFPTRNVVAAFSQDGESISEINLVNREEWERYATSTESGTARIAHIVGAYPDETIKVYPRQSTGKIVLTYRTNFAEIANLSDPLPDPPEYDEPILYGLTVRLGAVPGLGRARDEVIALAKSTYTSLVTRCAMRNIPEREISASLRSVSDGLGSSSWQ